MTPQVTFPLCPFQCDSIKGSTTNFRQLPVLTGNDSSDQKSDTIPRIFDLKNICPEIFKPLAELKKISPNLR